MSQRISLQVKKRPGSGPSPSPPSPSPPGPRPGPIKTLTPLSMYITDEIRTRAREILTTKIGQYFSEKNLQELEDHIHLAAIKCMEKKCITDRLDRTFQRSYDQILKNMCIHLNPEAYIKNTYLLEAVKSGVFTLDQLPYMNIIDLNPKAWDKQLQTRQAETLHVTEGPAVATTTLIKCKCGSGVKYTEEQTRSADEAMTIKAECVACGNRFNI
jgi:DNA-directed RNA polymerase subunit M/transcription elongation factor TFIIS